MSESTGQPEGIGSDREQPESTPADSEAGVGRSWRLRAVRIAKAVGAAVPVWLQLVVAFVGLLFVLVPALKPDDPPATKGASVTIASLDRVSFGQYLDRIPLSRSVYRRAKLERPGELIGVNIRVNGYRGKRLPLASRTVDARTGDEVQRSRDLYYTPYASDDRNSWSIWVPLPRGVDRRFFVEVELVDDDRRATPLGRARTHRFRGR